MRITSNDSDRTSTIPDVITGKVHSVEHMLHIPYDERPLRFKRGRKARIQRKFSSPEARIVKEYLAYNPEIQEKLDSRYVVETKEEDVVRWNLTDLVHPMIQFGDSYGKSGSLPEAKAEAQKVADRKVLDDALESLFAPELSSKEIAPGIQADFQTQIEELGDQGFVCGYSYTLGEKTREGKKFGVSPEIAESKAFRAAQGDYNRNKNKNNSWVSH